MGRCGEMFVPHKLTLRGIYSFLPDLGLTHRPLEVCRYDYIRLLDIEICVTNRWLPYLTNLIARITLVWMTRSMVWILKYQECSAGRLFTGQYLTSGVQVQRLPSKKKGGGIMLGGFRGNRASMVDSQLYPPKQCSAYGAKQTSNTLYIIFGFKFLCFEK